MPFRDHRVTRSPLRTAMSRMPSSFRSYHQPSPDTDPSTNVASIGSRNDGSMRTTLRAGRSGVVVRSSAHHRRWELSMPDLLTPEVRAALTAGHLAHLVTLEGDGTPQVTVV